MSADVYVRTAPVCPTLRVSRLADNSIEVDCDANEWAVQSEADDFATWLAPVVRTCMEHDEIARAIGAEVVTVRRIANELAAIAKVLADARRLTKGRGRWRFTGGANPGGEPPNTWGSRS